MQDNTYCYPNSEVLINKLNITDKNELFDTEKELTLIRLHELQKHPIKGKYDINHLKKRSELGILTSDDLTIDITEGYEYYEYGECKNSDEYTSLYQAKIQKMDAEKTIFKITKSIFQN